MTPIIPEAKLHAAFSVFLQSKNNLTFNKPIQWIKMPVNEVVVEGFFPPFFAAVLARVRTSMRRHAGVVGYRPGARAYDQRVKYLIG